MLFWVSILLIGTLAVVGCGGPYSGIAPSSPYYEGTYSPPPPQYPYSTPWVGLNTPWVYYQGDWFLNGMLHYYFGSQYGWAPYYAYPPTYIVRPVYWYAPKWNTWYQQHPQFVQTFTQRYPYWRGHRHGQRYGQDFYNRYHRGQGIGWQKGLQGRAMERPHEVRRPASTQVSPPEVRKPGPYRATPAQGTPPGQRVGPTQAAPYQRPRPASAQQQQQIQSQQQMGQQYQQQQQKQQQRQIQRAPQPQPQQQQHQRQQRQQRQEKKGTQQPAQP